METIMFALSPCGAGQSAERRQLDANVCHVVRDATPGWLRGALFVALVVLLLADQALPAAAGFNVWTSLGPEGGMVQTLVIDPTTPRILYAGTWSGVFKSVDGGESWRAVNNGLINFNYSHRPLYRC